MIVRLWLTDRMDTPPPACFAVRGFGRVFAPAMALVRSKHLPSGEAVVLVPFKGKLSVADP